MISAADLEDLIKRCKYAQTHGFQIALAESIATELGYKGEAPPPKVVKFSPAHLLHLAGVGQPKFQASAKFAKVGKAKKAAAPAPEPKQEDIPTVPVDIKAVHAAVSAMKSEATVKAEESGGSSEES